MQEKNKQNCFFNTSRQLALPFTYKPRFISSDFINSPSNFAARTWLGISKTTYNVPDWPDRRLAIWGDSGTGKTHLLQIWAEREQALYIPASALQQTSSVYWSEKLQNKEIKAIVIDDADLVTDFHSLLHILNMTKELRIVTVLGGRSPPARWEVELPDLASRLRSIIAIKIEQPEEELLRLLFLRLIADRQLVIPTSIMDIIQLRLPRTAFAVRQFIERLDEITLVEQGGMTRNLVMKILDELSIL